MLVANASVPAFGTLGRRLDDANIRHLKDQTEVKQRTVIAKPKSVAEDGEAINRVSCLSSNPLLGVIGQHIL